MPVDPRLLEILVCPATRVPVKALAKERLKKLNNAIAAGAVSYADGTKCNETLTEALITEDSKSVYRISDGIPVMLTEEAIPTGQIQDWQ